MRNSGMFFHGNGLNLAETKDTEQWIKVRYVEQILVLSQVYSVG